MALESKGKKIQLGNEYSYYPLTRGNELARQMQNQGKPGWETKPEHMLNQIKIVVDYILPWGERKKRHTICEYDDEGVRMGIYTQGGF